MREAAKKGWLHTSTALSYLPGMVTGFWLSVWIGWVNSDYAAGGTILAALSLGACLFYDLWGNMSGHPDFRPVKRHKADIDEWKILRKLKLGPCRVCGTGYGYATELHHLVGRDLGGDDVPNNLVPLCRECHSRVEERALVACSLLRESLTLDELAYILVEKGEPFLNRYYPRSNAEDVQPTRETAVSS